MKHFMPYALIFGLVVQFVLPLGCTSRPLVPQHRVRSQSDAASAHISVLTVRRFDEDIRKKLQPNFGLDWHAALDRAVPDTLFVEDVFADIVRVKLGFAPPQTSQTVTSTMTRSSSAGNPSTQQSSMSSTSEKKPGETPTTAENAASAQSSSPSQAEGSFAKTPTTRPGLDPMLQYVAATALKQEVEMLNTYVNDAAIPDQYEAFVVRLQVSLLPRARNQPYDAYTTLSFLPVAAQGAAVEQVKLFGNQAGENSGPTTNPASAALRPVRILPLLVTDNLEAILRSSSQERVRAMTVALAAMVQGFGANGELASQVRQAQYAVGRDLNSLMTVARASDNSVRVRFGAEQIGPAEFAMVSRTHNVTVVLMLSKDTVAAMRASPPRVKIAVGAKTQIVDATSGAPLPTQADGELLAVARSTVLDVCGPEPSAAVLAAHSDHLYDLVNAAAQNDFFTFEGILSSPEYVRLLKYRARLWVELTTVQAQGSYTSTELDLRPR